MTTLRQRLTELRDRWEAKRRELWATWEREAGMENLIAEDRLNDCICDIDELLNAVLDETTETGDENHGS